MKTNMIFAAGLLIGVASIAAAAPKAVCNQYKADALQKGLMTQAESAQDEIRPTVEPRLAAIKTGLADLRKQPGFDDGVAAAARDYSEITRKTYDRRKNLELLDKISSEGFGARGLIMSEETYVNGVESANQIALKVVADEMMAASSSQDSSYRGKSRETALKMLALYADLRYDFMIMRAILTSALGNDHQISTVQAYAASAARALPDGYIDNLTWLTAEARTCREK